MSGVNEYNKQVEKILEELRALQELAFDKRDWVRTVRDKYLGGALGEFTKQFIADAVGIKDYSWKAEVKRLLRGVEGMMQKRAGEKFDKLSALKEAMKDAMMFQFQVTDAKNELARKYHQKYKKIRNLDLDSHDLFPKMVREYLGEYVELLPEIGV